MLITPRTLPDLDDFLGKDCSISWFTSVKIDNKPLYSHFNEHGVLTDHMMSAPDTLVLEIDSCPTTLDLTISTVRIDQGDMRYKHDDRMGLATMTNDNYCLPLLVNNWIRIDYDQDCAVTGRVTHVVDHTLTFDIAIGYQGAHFDLDTSRNFKITVYGFFVQKMYDRRFGTKWR